MTTRRSSIAYVAFRSLPFTASQGVGPGTREIYFLKNGDLSCRHIYIHIHINARRGPTPPPPFPPYAAKDTPIFVRARFHDLIVDHRACHTTSHRRSVPSKMGDFLPFSLTQTPLRSLKWKKMFEKGAWDISAFELQPPHNYSHTLSTSHPLRVLISALVVPDWAGTAEWGGD